LLNKLRKERFDLVVILYNNITGKGYFHLHIISFLITPISIFIYDVEENYYKLNFFRLFCKQTLLYLVFYPVSIILFIFGYIFVFLPAWTLIKMKIFVKSKGGNCFPLL
ncbi:hypothetical protein KKC52_12455, partial [bacterium]|nr:hypothetical protein [bacterium]